MNKRQYEMILTYVNDFSGATVDATTGDIALLNAGYMVSLAGYEKQVKKLSFRALQKAEKTARNLGGFLGIWADDGIIYLDVSVCVDNIETALILGKKHAQKAIFDNNLKNSIYL